jgi:hypothetical protein
MRGRFGYRLRASSPDGPRSRPVKAAPASEGTFLGRSGFSHEKAELNRKELFMKNLAMTTAAAIALLGSSALAQTTTQTDPAQTQAQTQTQGMMPDFANMIRSSDITNGNIYSMTETGTMGTGTTGTTGTMGTGTAGTGTAGTGTTGTMGTDTTGTTAGTTTATGEVGATPGTAPAPGLAETAPGTAPVAGTATAPGTAGTTDAWGTTTAFDTVDPNWQNIGNIDDVILNREGQMIGIIGDIGGWLGIGSRQVFLPVADVRLVPAGDNDFAYVTRYTQEQLEQLPDVSDGWMN